MQEHKNQTPFFNTHFFSAFDGPTRSAIISSVSLIASLGSLGNLEVILA